MSKTSYNDIQNSRKNANLIFKSNLSLYNVLILYAFETYLLMLHSILRFLFLKFNIKVAKVFEISVNKPFMNILKIY